MKRKVWGLIPIAVLLGLAAVMLVQNMKSVSSEDLQQLRFENDRYFLNVTLGDLPEKVIASAGEPDQVYENDDLKYYQYDDVSFLDRSGKVNVYWDYGMPGATRIIWSYAGTEKKDVQNMASRLRTGVSHEYKKANVKPDGSADTYRKGDIEFVPNYSDLGKTADGETIYTASLTVRDYYTKHRISDQFQLLKAADPSDMAMLSSRAAKEAAIHQVYPQSFVALREGEYEVREKLAGTGKKAGSSTLAETSHVYEKLVWSRNNMQIISLADQSDLTIDLLDEFKAAGLDSDIWQMDPHYDPQTLTVNADGRELPGVQVRCVDTTKENDPEPGMIYVQFGVDGDKVIVSTSEQDLAAAAERTKEEAAKTEEQHQWLDEMQTVEQFFKDELRLNVNMDLPGMKDLTVICIPDPESGNLLVQLSAAKIQPVTSAMLERFPGIEELEWADEDVLTLCIGGYPSADMVEEMFAE